MARLLTNLCQQQVHSKNFIVFHLEKRHMTFSLTFENAYDYLVKLKVCEPTEKHLCQIECKSSKNFNLLVSLPSKHYLIKQEYRNSQGQTKSELEKEWQIQKLCRDHPELNFLASLITEAISFNPDDAILTLKYLDDYCELRDFYLNTNNFSEAIAAALGEAIAKIHRSTLEKIAYQDYFAQNYGYYKRLNKINRVIDYIEQNTPEARKFLELSQRYPSLGIALEEVNSSLDSCCLIHNDLKLNNVLLYNNWQDLLTKDKVGMIKIIDWEKWAWGDPRIDLSSIFASYLRIWLTSIVLTKNSDIQTSLRLAETPLEKIQPSLVATIKSYLTHFPEILERYDDFCASLIQFIGLALIRDIEIDLFYQEPLTNNSICILQVAKTLLCSPKESIPAIFGMTSSELL